MRRRITTNISAPPLDKLSPTQSHIPILLLSTSDAKSLASKNNLTIPELFTAMGNSLPTHAPSILGRLAPFRSFNHSIMLNCDLFGNSIPSTVMPGEDDVNQKEHNKNESEKATVDKAFDLVASH